MILWSSVSGHRVFVPSMLYKQSGLLSKMISPALQFINVANTIKLANSFIAKCYSCHMILWVTSIQYCNNKWLGVLEALIVHFCKIYFAGKKEQLKMDSRVLKKERRIFYF